MVDTPLVNGVYKATFTSLGRHHPVTNSEFVGHHQTQEGLRIAEQLELPISHDETLFSTPEDAWY
jgi:hypothetical protein